MRPNKCRQCRHCLFYAGLPHSQHPQTPATVVRHCIFIIFDANYNLNIFQMPETISNGKFISHKELAAAYNITRTTLKKELKLIPLLQLRPMQRYFSPKQIEIIFEHLGTPNNYTNNNMEQALSKCCQATIKVKYKLMPGSKVITPAIDFYYCTGCHEILNTDTWMPAKRNGIKIIK